MCCYNIFQFQNLLDCKKKWFDASYAHRIYEQLKIMFCNKKIHKIIKLSYQYTRFSLLGANLHIYKNNFISWTYNASVHVLKNVYKRTGNEVIMPVCIHIWCTLKADITIIFCNFIIILSVIWIFNVLFFIKTKRKLFQRTGPFKALISLNWWCQQ